MPGQAVMFGSVKMSSCPGEVFAADYVTAFPRRPCPKYKMPTWASIEYPVLTNNISNVVTNLSFKCHYLDNFKLSHFRVQERIFFESCI